MKRISVKLKVTLWYTGIIAVISIITILAMSSIMQSTIKNDIHRNITRVVTDFSRRITMHGKFDVVPPPNFFYDQGVHIVLYDNNKNVIGGHVPFNLDSKDFSFRSNDVRETNYNSHFYYEYDKKITTHDNKIYWVKGIMSLDEKTYAILSVTQTNIALSLIMVIVAGIGGYIIINRAFVPVNKIRETANKIAKSTDLSQRINLTNGKDEIHALAQTFDEMLEKIEVTLEKEKQFTSDASHELRTPVAVILSECEYMETCAKTTEEYAEASACVKRQAEKMQKLISELLTISRMDKNTLQANFEDIDISELLTFICDEQEEIQEKAITLKKDIQNGIVAYCDRFLLARLFINLISNAYQYNKENGSVSVTLKTVEKNVVFTVKDTGIGISEENIEKIWERFYQEDSSRSQNENGSMGLGLSMVKWIGECHNGFFTVKSEKNVGSEFTFTFPQDKTNL